MRKFVISMLLVLSAVVSVAYGQQEPNDSSGDIGYVTDDLTAFMHSGPGRNYRIIGTIVAGTRLSVLQEDQEKEFVEIIDDQQRTGWVESQYITRQQSIREVLPEIQQQLSETSRALEQQNQSNNQLNQQLTEVTKRNARLMGELEDLQNENQKIQQELDTQDQSAQMEWLTRGGIIALASIILGVIIAYLPKKRRRNDQWM